MFKHMQASIYLSLLRSTESEARAGGQASCRTKTIIRNNDYYGSLEIDLAMGQSIFKKIKV
jgi:hypothetical protein